MTAFVRYRVAVDCNQKVIVFWWAEGESLSKEWPIYSGFDANLRKDSS
jgi:hypothetical protein